MCQASLSFTISWSLLRLMSVESVMPSNHLYYGDEFLIYPPAGKTFILSVVLGAVNSLWVVLMHYLHAIRKINR